MIEQLNNAIVFKAFFVEGKIGKTGLTVTVDIYSPAGTKLVTTGSATEVGDGLYTYTLSSSSVTTEGEYVCIFKTPTATVDQQNIPSLWTVGRAGIENLDASISSIRAQISLTTCLPTVTPCSTSSLPTGSAIPRQLHRWLDVNPLRGPLQRTRGCIIVPITSATYVWLGYSEIVASYTYEASVPFSFLLDSSTLPEDVNHVCSVMWREEDGTTYRYKLWGDVGVFYFDMVQYEGQKIGKNFVIEFWSANDSPAVLTSLVQLWTTVLGTQDYRSGTDFILAAYSTLCQGQHSEDLTFPLTWGSCSVPAAN